MDANELLKSAKGWLGQLSQAFEDGCLNAEEGEQDELDDLISDIEKHLGE